MSYICNKFSIFSVSNKKILLIIQDLDYGGAEKVFISLANGFAKEGHSVCILLGKRIGVYFDLVHEAVVIDDLDAITLLDYCIKLPGYFKKREFTHVFTAFDYISVAIYLIKKWKRYNFTFIATLHYDLPYQLSIIPKVNKVWLSWVNKTFIAKADKLISVSKGVGRGFEKVVGKHLDNLQTIYNPVFSDAIFRYGAEPLNEPLKGKKNIIFLGRLAEQKAPLFLLQTFSLVQKKMPEVHLYIVGDGPLRSDMEEYISLNKLTPFVHLMGFDPNPYKYLAKGNLLVLSSLYEGLGNVIIEALALGINVVSTDCPSGPGEILDNGKYGWLSPVSDATKLSYNIIDALENPMDSAILQGRAEMFIESVIVKEYLPLLE